MSETQMETETTTTEIVPTAEPIPTAEEAAPAAAPKTDVIGRLTPEEHQNLMSVREESQKLLQKLGEYEVLKARVLHRVEELDGVGQGYIDAISQRLNIAPGQQWIAVADGTVRVVNPAPTPGGAGGPTPS
jgi:hypothetical protein